MVKLLIVDDEPLVCVGLRSMLRWEELGIEIIGTARNGKEALNIIESSGCDIVISDIKMPAMTGLDLTEECTRRYGRIPLFIVLTSYDDFELARRALKAQVVDYLIKLELTPEILHEAIKKATNILTKIKYQEGIETAAGHIGIHALREKFFIKLYNNLFETEEQYKTQKTEAEIEFPPGFYTAAICAIANPKNAPLTKEKLIILYGSAVQMAQETLSNTLFCYVTSIDMRQFCIAINLQPRNHSDQHMMLKKTLTKMSDMIHNYLNITLQIAVGHVVDSPEKLTESYMEAKRISQELTESRTLIFGDRRQGYRQQMVMNIQKYIHENLQNHLSLNSVAAALNLSPGYLSQLFAKTVGESFIEYITSARIAAAKEMLTQGELRIYEIAERLGFGSAFYFSKVFKKTEGVSPREYLKRLYGNNIHTDIDD